MTESAPASRPASDPQPRDERTWRQVFATFPRGVWWTAYGVVGLVLLLVVLLVVGAALVRRPLPQTQGSVTIPGLGGEVEVIRDEHGIPHLYADTDADLVRGQGYVQAQERFFEMDVRRHVTSGRLAELFGEAALPTDKTIRTMGWRRVAEQELALLEPDTRDLLTAYAAGVNAYLDDHDPSEIAVEYGVLALSGLDYEPEPWTPVDSLAWLKAMAWDLRANMVEEIDRVAALVDLSRAELRGLYPEYDGRAHPPIVSGGGVVDGVFEQDATGNATRNPRRPAYSPAMVRALQQVRERVHALPEMVGRGDGIGSNSWVVDGEHSATGQPILANDPHLSTGQPGIWMQMGLHCRDLAPDCTLDVSGFTFSGMPGVMIGHNADIAWGFTNLAPDVTDLYLERIRGDRWVREGRTHRLRVRTETIEVRDGEDFELTIRETDHGPLLSDVSAELSTVGANAPVAGRGAGERGNGYAVALSWTALDPQPTADAIFGLNRAATWEEFREAASDLAAPAQNLVYADREGHIGYQATGRVPVRGSGNDGRLPSEGWLPENDWTGDHIPFAGLPTVLDPDEGFVVAANQQVIGEQYPGFLTDDWDLGYRSTRIRRLIEAEGDLSVGEMATMQLDTWNPMAAQLVPFLLDIDDLPSDYYRGGQELLVGWDLTQPADSAPAAYFNVVWRRLLSLTFDDDLRRRNWPDGGDRWFAVVAELLREPAHPWWDDATTDEVETRDEILLRAMLDARDELTKRQSLDPEEWRWGHLHRMNLHHSTLGESGVGPVEWLLNRDGHQVGGGSSILNATSWDAHLGYDVTAAPSMRMVVSLGDLDRSLWVNLTGVSGHPASPHYDDQTDLWVEGRYLPWASTRDAVVEAGEDTLTLEPARAE